jgi:hypothetical protein
MDAHGRGSLRRKLMYRTLPQPLDHQPTWVTVACPEKAVLADCCPDVTYEYSNRSCVFHHLTGLQNQNAVQPICQRNPIGRRRDKHNVSTFEDRQTLSTSVHQESWFLPLDETSTSASGRIQTE